MERSVLQSGQWEAIKDLLPGKSTDCGITAVNNRLFTEAVLWIARTGAAWRDLPEKLGIGIEFMSVTTDGLPRVWGIEYLKHFLMIQIWSI